MPTVIVPWREGCRHREAAWAWVHDRYEAFFPSWEVVCARAEPFGAWVKADAVHPALCACVRSEVVVVADADVWARDLGEAVDAVAGGASWAVPHRQVCRLSADATAAVLAGAEPAQELGLAQVPYKGVAGGGIVVARAETLIEIPLDPRFENWGQEDASWGTALTTLLGRPQRSTGPLYHLWHPPAERMDRRWGSRAGMRLRRRYAAARGNQAAIRRLLDEVKDEPAQPDQSRVLDHEALDVGGSRCLRGRGPGRGDDRDGLRAPATPHR